MSAPPLTAGLVDERVARSVAGVVTGLAVATLVTHSPLLMVLLTGGFAIRALLGPRWSPTARAARWLLDLLDVRRRMTPAPPKRFAQAIGLAMSSTALAVLLVSGDMTIAARALVAAIAVAALLEAAIGLCIGCRLFAVLMRIGVIPEHVCVACAVAADDRGTR